MTSLSLSFVTRNSPQSLEGGHPECLQYLLDYGGDANMAEKQGCTPLHVAAKMGEVEAATLLLERNARIDAVEKVRRSPRRG